MKPSGPGLLFVGRFFFFFLFYLTLQHCIGFGKISDYGFNFRACDGSVKIFYSFLVEFWKVQIPVAPRDEH